MTHDQLNIAHIDEKSPENRDIGSLIAARSSIDHIRGENNQKKI